MNDGKRLDEILENFQIEAWSGDIPAESDKDKAEAKTALLQLIKEKEVEAAIAELSRPYLKYEITGAGKAARDDRISELQQEQNRE